MLKQVTLPRGWKCAQPFEVLSPLCPLEVSTPNQDIDLDEAEQSQDPEGIHHEGSLSETDLPGLLATPWDLLPRLHS